MASTVALADAAARCLPTPLAPRRRLTTLARHFSTGSAAIQSAAASARRHKLVVCRDIGPDVMPILRAREGLDVRNDQDCPGVMPGASAGH